MNVRLLKKIRRHTLSHHLRMSLSLFCLIWLGVVACADQSENATPADTRSLGKGDDVTESGDPSLKTHTPGVEGQGRFGGIYLVTGLTTADCLAYPISDRLLVTPWSCVSECSASVSCDFALVTEGDNFSYYGLTEGTYRLEKGDQSLALLQAAESQPWAKFLVSASAGQTLSTVDGAHKLVSSDEWAFTTEGPESQGCEFVGLGLFNVNKALVGLRSGVTTCNDFIALAPFLNQIESALNGDLESFARLPLPQVTSEEEEEEEERRQEEEEEEEAWSSEESAAEAQASECASGDPSYCVGDVEMTCQSGVYKAFNCQRVGWSCVKDDSWGYGCYPSDP